MSMLNTSYKVHSFRLRENLRDIPSTIKAHLLSGDSILKKKQQEAAQSTADKMLNEYKRALALIMPTGTGKTVILAQMLAGLKEDEKTGHKPKKIIIVTDSKEGVTNTRSELKQFANINAGVYYGDKKDIKGKQVIITTYDSWQSEDFPIDPNDIDLVVLDEAHRGISEPRMETLQKHENSVFLALTASPTYDEERDLLKYFELAYKMTVQDAVAYNLISSFRNIVLNSEVELDLDELAESEEGLDSALEREIKKETMNQIGIEYLVHGLHYDTGQPLRDIRGIVSCVDTEHAETVAKQLNDEYNKAHPDKPFKYKFAEFITGDSPDRDDILDRHKAGETQYLAYADLLNQNYNDKKIGVVLNLRLTESLVLAIQRAGRALRINEDDLGKIALIIDIFHKFKGRFKKQPLFYAHAIGSAALITHEAEKLATGRSFGASKISLERQAEAKAEAKAMNFSIQTDEDSILGIFNDLIFLGLRNKTEIDLTHGDLVALGIPAGTVRKALQDLEREWLVHEEGKEQGILENENPEPSVKVYKLRMSKGAPTLAINNDPETIEAFSMYAIGKSYGVQEKTEMDLTHIDLIKTGISGTTVRKGLSNLEQAWLVYEDNKTKGVLESDNPKPPVSVYKVKHSIGGEPAPAINNDPETIEAFKAYALGGGYGVRQITEQDITSTGLFEKLNISQMSIGKKLKNLEKAWLIYEENKAKNIPDADNPEPPVRAYKVKFSKGAPVLAINNDASSIEAFEIYALGDVYGVQKKTKQDLTRIDLVKAGLKETVVQKGLSNLEKAWLIYEEKKAKGVPETDNLKPPVKVHKVKSAVGPTLAIHNDPEIIRAFKMYALYDANGVPEKTENDLTHIDLVKSGIGPERVVRSLKNLEQAWHAYEENKAKNVSDADSLKPSIQVYTVKSGAGPTLAIHNDSETVEIFKAYALKDAYGVPEKTENDLTPVDLLKHSISKDRITKALKSLEQAWLTYEEKAKSIPETENPKPPVKVYTVKSGGLSLAIHNDLKVIEQFKIYALGDAYGVRKKTENDLSSKDLAKKGGTSTKTMAQGLQALDEAWVVYNENKAKGVPEANNPEPPVKVYKVNSSNVTLAINNDPKIVEAFMKYTLSDAYGVSEKSEKDLTIGDLKKMGISVHTVEKGLYSLEQAWLTYNDKKLHNVQHAENAEPPIKVYKVKFSKGVPSLAINNDSATVEAFKLFVSEKNNLLIPPYKNNSKNRPPKPE